MTGNPWVAGMIMALMGYSLLELATNPSETKEDRCERERKIDESCGPEGHA